MTASLLSVKILHFLARHIWMKKLKIKKKVIHKGIVIKYVLYFDKILLIMISSMISTAIYSWGSFVWSSCLKYHVLWTWTNLILWSTDLHSTTVKCDTKKQWCIFSAVAAVCPCMYVCVCVCGVRVIQYYNYIIIIFEVLPYTFLLSCKAQCATLVSEIWHYRNDCYKPIIIIIITLFQYTLHKWHQFALMGYTCQQGTTGFPKGATLSHHNIVNNSYSVGRRLDYHTRVRMQCNLI